MCRTTHGGLVDGSDLILAALPTVYGTLVHTAAIIPERPTLTDPPVFWTALVEQRQPHQGMKWTAAKVPRWLRFKRDRANVYNQRV